MKSSYQKHLSFMEVAFREELYLVKKNLMNRYVRLKRGGKYKGRKALVTDIMLDHDGSFLALAYVLKKYPNGEDSEAWLNSKPETRQYWKINDLEWL